MKAETPAGEMYRIHRRWLPWRRRARPDALEWCPDLPGVDLDMGDDPIGLVIVSILLIPLLAIVALVLGEVLLLLLLLPFFVLSRSVFGTPWVIEVWQGHKILHFEAVEGWGESSQRIERLATQVREGHLPLGNRPRDDLRRDDLPQDHPPQDDLAQGHLPQDNPSQGGKGQPTFQDMLREDRPS